MDITAALMLFCVLAFIYLSIIEIFTILFRLTGLTYDKSHFQVISMLTTCGFTTQDSEPIATSKIRRKLATGTILFGYLFNVVIMSSIVNIFLSLNNSQVDNMWSAAVVIVCFISLIFMLNRSPTIKSKIDHFIEKIGNRVMYGNNVNTIVLIDVFGENVMAEIYVSTLPPELEGVELKNSGLKEKYKIQLILVKRGNETKSILKGEDVLMQNDTVIVFGDYENIKMLFKQ